MSRESTFFLYGCTFIISILLAALSQYFVRSKKLQNICFFLSFCSLWFVSCFTKIGVDYENYARYIRIADLKLATTEYGFNVLCYIAKMLSGTNTDLGIFILKTFGLALFFISFSKFKGKISLPLAVFAFDILLFLRFYIMAMYIACGLVFVSLAYFIVDRKYIKAILLYLFACSVHSSAILLAPIYILLLIRLRYKGRDIGKLGLFIIILGYSLALALAGPLYTYFVSKFSVFMAYSNYGAISNYQGLGVMQIVFYLPLLFFCYAEYKKDNDYLFGFFTVVFCMTGFFYALLGYKFEVMSRMSEYFMFICIIVVPMILKNNITLPLVMTRKSLISKQLIVLWFVYVSIRGYDVLRDMLQISSNANLANWKFFWPF